MQTFRPNASVSCPVAALLSSHWSAAPVTVEFQFKFLPAVVVADEGLAWNDDQRWRWRGTRRVGHCLGYTDSIEHRAYSWVPFGWFKNAIVCFVTSMSLYFAKCTSFSQFYEGYFLTSSSAPINGHRCILHSPYPAPGGTRASWGGGRDSLFRLHFWSSNTPALLARI